jgi:hypothetical protein
MAMGILNGGSVTQAMIDAATALVLDAATALTELGDGEENGIDTPTQHPPGYWPQPPNWQPPMDWPWGEPPLGWRPGDAWPNIPGLPQPPPGWYQGMQWPTPPVGWQPGDPWPGTTQPNWFFREGPLELLNWNWLAIGAAALVLLILIITIIALAVKSKGRAAAGAGAHAHAFAGGTSGDFDGNDSRNRRNRRNGNDDYLDLKHKARQAINCAFGELNAAGDLVGQSLREPSNRSVQDRAMNQIGKTDKAMMKAETCVDDFLECKKDLMQKNKQ